MTAFFSILCALALQTQLPLAPTPGAGLAPLEPPTDSPSGKELRLEPSSGSVSIRKISPDDQVTYLRSQGAWYEIEVKTREGLIFRGWFQSELATARRLAEPTPVSAPKAQPKPITSQRFVMFWDKRAVSRGSLKLAVGPQQSIYSLSGIVSGGSREKISPGYNFLGGHFGLEADFIPLSTSIGQGFSFSPIICASYAYGLHRVAFGNPFADVPEVSGQAYSIDTNTYQIEAIARISRKMSSVLELSFGVGAGFVFHEVAPDLDPISGSNELIFVEQTTSGLMIPVEVSVKIQSRYSLSLGAKPILLSSFRETPEVTPNPEFSTLPWILQSTFGWQYSQRFGLELSVQWLDLKASGSEAAVRLGENFDDGEINTSFRKADLGIRWSF
jgi:hypothetical protein